jgi:hypothetical protein
MSYSVISATSHFVCTAVPYLPTQSILNYQTTFKFSLMCYTELITKRNFCEMMHSVMVATSVTGSTISNAWCDAVDLFQV